MKLIQLSILWILTIAATATGFAEDEFHSFKFSAFCLLPGDYSGLHFLNSEKEWTEISFKSKSRSNLYEAEVSTKNLTLTFYGDVQGGIDPAYRPLIASVQINPQWKSVLLIFSKQSAPESGPYTVMALDDSATVLPKGHLRIVNLTGADIMGAIDNSRIELNHLSASKNHRVQTNETTQVAIAAESKGRTHLLYKNTISVSRQSRSLLILRPPKRNGSVKIMGQLLLDYGSEE